MGGWGGGGWGGWVDGVGVVGDVPHTCAHAHAFMHMHAHTRVCGKHDNFMQMAAPIGGNPWEFPMVSYVHVYACVHIHAHACAHVWGHPLTTPHPHLPTPHPLGGPPGISQNSIALELIEIFQFRLKI